MKTHRINLQPLPGDKAKMTYAGQVLGLSRQPLFASARKLLAGGLAEPNDRIETWRGETLCLSGPIWAAAKLIVKETPTGPRFGKYESTAELKQRVARYAIGR